MSIEPEESSQPRPNVLERLVPWALVVVTFVIVTAAFFLFPNAYPTENLPGYLSNVAAFGWLVGAAVIGALITSNRRGNRIGWLLLGICLVVGVVVFLARAGETEIPAADALNLLSDLAWVLFISLFASLILLCPDGRPLSPRWRPMVWFTALWGPIFWVMGVVVAPEEMLAETPSPRHPAQIALGVLLLVTFTGVVVSAFLRFARSRGVERQQLKWFAYATGVGVAMSILGTFVPVWGGVVSNLGLFGPLVGIAIALFRHRLYDIDVLISRTFVYGALIAILAGLYSASIRLFNALFVGATGLSSEEVLVITTLILATTFTPIKKRLEDIVERRYKRPTEAAAVTPGAIASDLAADPAFFAAIDGRLRAIVRDELKRSGPAR
jgi:hypothetical protein